MSRFSTSRLTRAAVGVAAVSAFALAPMAAQAADPVSASKPLGGTIASGPFTISAPDLQPFQMKLTGVVQNVDTQVGTMNVNDATGSNRGYEISVIATAPTVTNDKGVEGAVRGGSISLTPQQMTPTDGDLNRIGPVNTKGEWLSLVGKAPVVIATAGRGTGQGSWDTTADSPKGTVNSLRVVVPGDASAGHYASTLTFTSTQLAAA